MKMRIKLLAMDVDGVLTDGMIGFDSEGREIKFFHVRDGMGICALMEKGVKVAFISGRFSEVTAHRARDLGVTLVFQGVRDKLGRLVELALELGVTREEVAYIGDDVNDIPCIEWAGFGVAVADAPAEVRNAASYVTLTRGGHGAVREVCDLILKSMG